MICNLLGWKWLQNICVLCGQAFSHGFNRKFADLEMRVAIYYFHLRLRFYFLVKFKQLVCSTFSLTRRFSLII